MKYLITGGAGFIGINFAEKLLARGDEVILLDNLSRKGSIYNLSYIKQKYPQTEFIHADLRVDYEKLRSLIEQVDVVFHLAGQVAVTRSVEFPQEDFDINALGTLHVLEAIRNSERKPAIIYSSTNKVYGEMIQMDVVKKDKRYIYKDYPEGVSEDMSLDFQSPYGCSKGAADQYIRDYARIYKIQTVVMRQSCIYGVRQFGVEDQGWVAWFTIAAKLGKPITIYGDGMQVRDVLYVDDLFDAWDVATKNINKISGQIFNIGGGSKYTMSLLELVAHLEEMLGLSIKYTFDEWRPGDQKIYVSDISKANKVLGWAPKTNPKEGVQLLTNWIVENKDLLEKELSQ